VEFTDLVVYRIKDGRIAESWGEIDFLRLVRELRRACQQPLTLKDMAREYLDEGLFKKPKLRPVGTPNGIHD